MGGSGCYHEGTWVEREGCGRISLKESDGNKVRVMEE